MSASAKIIPLGKSPIGFASQETNSSSLLKKFKMSLFPSVEDIYVLVNKQSVLMEEILDHLDSFLQDNSTMEAEKIAILEQKRDDLKLGYLSEMTKTFPNPLRDDIHRAIQSIDTAIDFTKNTVQEMQMLEITADDHILGMVALLREGTELLSQGLDNLAVNRQQSAKSFEELRRLKQPMDKAFRLAISQLFTADAEIKALAAQEDDAKTRAFSRVVEIFKRREVYRHIYNAGDHLSLAGGALFSLVGHGI
ncbi:MAG: hypothetical protein G8345_03400 [Magnetococcales bacterium]|nr:hypothetical protein [Magnetococcales bacterium]NGZ25920.1 hypothetical protein [Magnetococcales bacterium]